MADDDEGLRSQFNRAFSEELKHNRVALDGIRSELGGLKEKLAIANNNIEHLVKDLAESKDLRIRERIESLEATRAMLRGMIIALTVLWAILSAVVGWLVSIHK